jgi:zinc transport system substrate-binding protein
MVLIIAIFGAMHTPRLFSLLAITTLFASCSTSQTSNPADAGRLTIAASFYPIAEIVQRLGGDDVELLSLTAPGVEPHDSELSAKQLDELAKTDIVFYIGGGFQPDLEKAIESLPSNIVAVDLLKSVETLEEKEHGDAVEDDDGHAHSGADPHVWLDPANMAEMAITVAAEISKVESFDATAALTERLNAYATELNEVGTLIDTAFASCERKELVTAHDAFAYFAHRANLTTVPIAGVDPETEPSAKDLEATAAIAQKSNVTTVFFEEILPKEFADTVARLIGAKVDSINAVETISQSDLDAGVTYSSIMKENIAKVAAGLGCK